MSSINRFKTSIIAVVVALAGTTLPSNHSFAASPRSRRIVLHPPTGSSTSGQEIGMCLKWAARSK